ncbi:hypothetical protein [Actinoplanes sp. URMC 104]|uniref:hypothetical protein n=1 Tax=Actinoplanes sp. URMC 104 TaxID=3423409 RepID=UPI003F1CAAC2
MSGPALSPAVRDLLAAAQREDIVYLDGWFAINGVALVRAAAQQAHDLVAAGLLAHQGHLLVLTAAGRQALR